MEDEARTHRVRSARNEGETNTRNPHERPLQKAVVTKNKYRELMMFWKIGGADGIRTHDLLDAIEARSQLRHGPTVKRS
jgi:hypothetical protein